MVGWMGPAHSYATDWNSRATELLGMEDETTARGICDGTTVMKRSE